jgi:hypothetical protein
VSLDNKLTNIWIIIYDYNKHGAITRTTCIVSYMDFPPFYQKNEYVLLKHLILRECSGIEPCPSVHVNSLCRIKVVRTCVYGSQSVVRSLFHYILHVSREGGVQSRGSYPSATKHEHIRNVFQRLALSKGPHRVGFPSPEDGDRSSLRNVVFFLSFVF